MSSGKMCISCCCISTPDTYRCPVCGCLHFIDVDEDETDEEEQ
jgi:hypothetical protein